MKIVVVFFSLFFLVGCGSIQISNSPPPFRESSYPQVPYNYKPSVKKVEESAGDKLAVGTYHYGRFKVLVYADRSQVIDGGIFHDLPPLAFTSKKKHVFVINYQTKEFMYYRLGDKGYDPVIGYAVVTPAADSLKGQVVRGIVTEIVTKPNWCPTENIRKTVKDLPAGCLPYGHPKNFMGEAKFVIAWQGVKGWDLKRVHGTNGYPLGNFWEEKTFGCTRIENQAMLQLLDLLGSKSTVINEGVEVIVYASL